MLLHFAARILLYFSPITATGFRVVKAVLLIVQKWPQDDEEDHGQTIMSRGRTGKKPYASSEMMTVLQVAEYLVRNPEAIYLLLKNRRIQASR